MEIKMTHGGKREGAGRKKGAVTKAKKDLAEMAKEHAEKALGVLVQIAQGGESEAARVSAANAILDRAYGKPAQSMDHKSSDGSMSPKPASFDLATMTDDELEAYRTLAAAADRNRKGD